MSGLLLLTVLVSVSAPAIALRSFQSSPSGEQETVREAYIELKAADNAGANISALAERFNMALELLERAQALSRTGDQADALQLTSQANSSMSLLIPEAQRLQERAISQRQGEALERLLLPPIEALMIAIVVIVLANLRRWMESKQFNELRIKVKTD